ncbi:HSP20-like chaperone [Rhodotorula diobovata]|uniref:HSP20-like chaperone n=1 Tax=Rhodotorula diobovata TaxID=5288 RepID=A0A5C5FW34_9BASI|nr:HSP20-like chaperone [Rhodotorula diobovata]
MSKIRHEWYQTDQEVVVSVFIRNVKEEDLKVDLQERSLTLTVSLPTGSDVVFDLDPLAHPIDVAASSHRVLQPKIELKLKKKDGAKWGKLEGDEQAVASMGAPVEKPTQHAYPSSSRKQHNWDDIVKQSAEEDEQLSKEFSKDPNAGGDAALNQLFQKLYADATDDQRRAMIKSYQESNGTALSTDWNDVGKRKVETHPPDSMVAKKFGA